MHERAFQDLSNAVPEFAGYLADDNGALVILVTDLTKSLDAITAVAELARSRNLRLVLRALNASPPRTLPADFTFTELKDWRERLTTILDGAEGILLLDLDERANRILVGVAHKDLLSAVEGRVRALGVPTDAVVLQVRGPFIPTTHTVHT
ncbi:MAG: hypothetical protein ACREME_02985, partial [Gemmatimonadales bacterium]